MEQLQERNKLSFWGILITIFAFLSPLESFLGSSAGSLLKLYTLGCIGLFVLRILAKKNYRFVVPAQWLFVFLFVVIIVSALSSSHFSRASDVLFAIGLQVVLILTATQIPYSRKDRDFILYGYIFGCLILAILLMGNVDQLAEGARVSAETEEGGVDPNNVAAYLVAGVAAVMTIHFERKYFTLLRWICMVFLVIAMLLTASRGAFLALLLFVIYHTITQKNIKDAMVTIFFIGVMAFLIIILSKKLFGLYNPIEILMYRFREDTGGSGRTDLWKIALELIVEKPIFGYGLAVSPYLFSETYVNHAIGSHNTYLTFWLECGIFGIGFFLSVYASLWRNRNKNNNFHTAVYSILFTSMITSFFIDTYNKKILWLPLLLCMIAVTSERYQKKDEIDSMRKE